MSADGERKAAVVDVECGATVVDMSWALIAAANKEFVDAADKVAVFEGPIERVFWKGSNLFVIYGHARPFNVHYFAKAT